jgi:hypothetical protein
VTGVKLLRKISGPKKTKVSEQFRILHHEEIYALHLLCIINNIVKLNGSGEKIVG